MQVQLNFIGVLIAYKSIALPPELQGYFVYCEIFILKAQLNQSKKVKLIETKYLKILSICVVRLRLARHHSNLLYIILNLCYSRLSNDFKNIKLE